MTKDFQGLMGQRDPEEFRALVDLQVIQAQRDFKEIRVSQVLLVLMVPQEPLVLDSKVLREKEARKEEQEPQDRLELVNLDSQGIWDLWAPRDQWVFLVLEVKENRGFKVQLVHLVHKDPQDKAHLVPREK